MCAIQQVDLKDKWRNLLKQGIVTDVLPVPEDQFAAQMAAQAAAAAAGGEGVPEGMAGIEVPADPAVTAEAMKEETREIVPHGDIVQHGDGVPQVAVSVAP